MKSIQQSFMMIAAMVLVAVTAVEAESVPTFGKEPQLHKKRLQQHRPKAVSHTRHRSYRKPAVSYKRDLRRVQNYQKSIDRKLGRHHARRRSFRSLEQFRRIYRHTGRYCNSRHIAKGYRHTRRSWYLAYLYERAFFYDRYGYEYGYFNRNGFMFEGVFYRYDSGYTYADRLRGRGLFDHRYYRPFFTRWGDLFAGLDREGFYFFAGFEL